MNKAKELKINVTTEGQGTALSVFHGWGMNSAAFEPFSDVMSSDYAVSRIDLPGHGLSDWLDHQQPIESCFDQQVARLSEVVPDSVLIGWSMGGLYALRLAKLYPERFSGLILVASNPCFVQREDWTAAVDSSVFKGFADAFIDNWQATIRRFLGLQMFGVDNVRAQIRHISQLLIKGGEPHPDALRFGLDLLLTQDVRDELSQIKVPVMVVLGKRDKLVPISLANELTQINAKIRVECLAHSAHAPFLSHLDDFAGLIHEFVIPASPR